MSRNRQRYKMGGEEDEVVTAIAAGGFSWASGVLRKLRGGRSQKIRWLLAFEAEPARHHNATAAWKDDSLAARSLARARIARAISIDRLPLSFSFDFAGDGEALLDSVQPHDISTLSIYRPRILCSQW